MLSNPWLLFHIPLLCSSGQSIIPSHSETEGISYFRNRLYLGISLFWEWREMGSAGRIGLFHFNHWNHDQLWSISLFSFIFALKSYSVFTVQHNCSNYLNMYLKFYLWFLCLQLWSKWNYLAWIIMLSTWQFT